MFPRIGLFAAMLAAAGVPLYILLPRYATVEMGLSLSTLGAVLLGIRVMDFAQDPLLGRLVDRPSVSLKVWALLGAVGLFHIVVYDYDHKNFLVRMHDSRCCLRKLI